jgi:dTDP-4-amino-4,6-dideoxygalactose transaminase
MKVPWAIPFVDDEELAEVVDAVQTNWLSMGKRVRALEEGLAAYVGVKNAVAVSNGTVALDLTLKVLNVLAGDEVILPAMTYVATLNTVLYQGAQPVFADIEQQTFNVDPDDVERKITSRTRCIICIDYGGNPADYDRLRAIALRHGVPLLQDAAQSMGGFHRGVPLGRQGDLATTSFHAAKILTTVEGGAIFTDDDAIAARLRILRNQGEDPRRKYIHVELGYNARLSDLHAAIGLAQWRKREQVLDRRAELAAAYSSRLRRLPGVRLPEARRCPDEGRTGALCCRNSWFFYPVLVPGRDHVAATLQAHGVETRVCYPIPVYEQPFYRARDPRGGEHRCPNAIAVTQQVINLPMFHALTLEQIDHVCAALGHATAGALAS